MIQTCLARVREQGRTLLQDSGAGADTSHPSSPVVVDVAQRIGRRLPEGLRRKQGGLGLCSGRKSQGGVAVQAITGVAGR